MSGYQYYDFLAPDKPLTDKQRAELRKLSSRADITATRFVNEYNYGDFRGSPQKLMERYFDAFLYLANWGTRQLMFRFPRALLDAEVARQYPAYGPDLLLSARRSALVPIRLVYLFTVRVFGGPRRSRG